MNSKLVTEQLLKVAEALEDLGNVKIKLTQAIKGRELSAEEREDIYFATIKDHLGLVFDNVPDIHPFQLAQALQLKEMFGCDHILFTAKDLQLERQPNTEEIMEHYRLNRAERFRTNFNTIMKS